MATVYNEEWCICCIDTDNPQMAEVRCASCDAPLCMDCAVAAEDSYYWRGLPPGTFYCPNDDCDRRDAGVDD